MTIHDKYRVLQENLKALGSVAVAFSSGVDSTFLLKAAQEALGDKVIAVTASSCSFPKRELEEAKAFCEKNGICQIIVESEELDIDGFRQNPKNRCYLCKHELFEKIWEIAKENGMNAVAEGSNMDDNGDYRPGLIAVKELGVSSPLRQAEQLLLDMGFHQVRVRIHGNIARIEVLPGEITKIVEEKNRMKIASKLKEYGFDYVTLDLLGYRTGSMNETLEDKEIKK